MSFCNRELESQIEGFAAGLQALGLQPGDRVRTVHACHYSVARLVAVVLPCIRKCRVPGFTPQSTRAGTFALFSLLCCCSTVELLLRLNWSKCTFDTLVASMRGLHPQVALFSENGARWLVADQGIMMAGGARLPSVEAPRCWVTALS